MTEVAAIVARYDGNVVHKETTEARGNKLFSLVESFFLFFFFFKADIKLRLSLRNNNHCFNFKLHFLPNISSIPHI